jgi:cytochrome c5
LIGIGKRLSGDQIAAMIHQGKGRMPTFPNITDTQLQSLLQFLNEESSSSKLEPTSDKQEATSLPGEAAPNPKGEALYQKHCAICHGDNRDGIQPSFPMLIGVGQRLSKEQVTLLIHQGKGRMPAFPKLQSNELDPLLHYLGVTDVAQASRTQEPQYSFTGYKKFVDPDHYPAVAPPWGTLSAIDLNTGNYLWQIPFGEYPALVAKGMKNTGSENYGGPVVTASGLLFIGATVFDHKFRAYDSRTGHLLWETQLPNAGRATPATYMVDGKQYVVLATGAVRFDPTKAEGAYVAFSLP